MQSSQAVRFPPKLALSACVVLALTGCISTDRAGSAGAPEPTRESAAVQAAPTPDPAKLQRLLWAAEDAIAAGHLTYPAEGSALLLYDRVLALDPDNAAAKRGLEIIVEHFLGEARAAIQQRQFALAETQLGRARALDPEHPGIAPTETQLALLSAAERRVINLEADALRARTESVQAQLRRLGDELRESGCRAQIHARNDAEGRWVYQALSGPTGSARIQAQLQIGSPPRIEVLCTNS